MLIASEATFMSRRVKTCSLMSWQMFHGQEQVISQSLFLASRVDLRTISSSIANTMGNDLSGNVGSPTATTSASHDQDHPQSSLSLYQIASPIDQEASSSAIPKDRSKGPRVVDAAEKVRTSYFNKGLAKVRMIFG